MNLSQGWSFYIHVLVGVECMYYMYVYIYMYIIMHTYMYMYQHTQGHTPHPRRLRPRSSLNASLRSMGSVDVSLLEASLFSLSSPATGSKCSTSFPGDGEWFASLVPRPHHLRLRPGYEASGLLASYPGHIASDSGLGMRRVVC